MSDELRKAAQAVLDRWDSPKWEWISHGPTADLMAALRAALAAAQPPSDAEHRAAFAAIYTALQPASPARSTWPAEIARLRAAAQPPAAMPVPLSRQQIDNIMTQHYPLDSLLRENVDAFEACVRDIEAAISAQPVPATGAQPAKLEP